MQEKVTQKTIALVIKTSKLNASVLKAAMRMYLNHRKQQAQNKHGKVSVKKLVGEGVGVSSIEVTDNNIKVFERVARKYNVDFAVKKDKTTDPPKYMVFFKGRDADVIAQAFKEFVYGNEKKKGRTSVREKLNKFTARRKEQLEALKARAEAGDQEAQSQLAEHKQYQVRATVKSYRKMRDDALSGDPIAKERYEKTLARRREAYHTKKSEQTA